MQGHNGSNSIASLKPLLFGAIFLRRSTFALLILGDWHLRIPIFLVLYFSAFAIYLFFVIQISRRGRGPAEGERGPVLRPPRSPGPGSKHYSCRIIYFSTHDFLEHAIIIWRYLSLHLGRPCSKCRIKSLWLSAGITRSCIFA